MHHFDWVSLLTGGFAISVLSHAAHTIPQPKSEWGRWIIGIFQFALANYTEGRSAMGGPPQSTAPSESLKPNGH
jgi:hypothetical protein